ncbi:MAG: transcription antitermination factor NusB [Gemmatimonadales bacterium]
MLRAETRGRARALQLLYGSETTGRPVAELVPGLARLTGPEPLVLDLAERLAAGVSESREALDRRIGDATEHWRPSRLSVIDRNILRLATFELTRELVPARVAIDEAIWLAQRFGTRESPRFVNGVLDRIARDLGRL